MAYAGRDIRRIGIALMELADLVEGYCNDVHDLEPVWEMQAQAEAGIANVLESVVAQHKRDLNRRRSDCHDE